MLLASILTPLGRGFSDFFISLDRDFRDFFTPLGLTRSFAPHFGIVQSRHTRLVMLTVRGLGKNKTVPANFAKVKKDTTQDKKTTSKRRL